MTTRCFRAWHKNTRKLHRAVEIFWPAVLGDDVAFVKTYDPAADTFYKCSPDEVVLMQSTGLKDKNGVEIFEGDIVRWETHHGAGPNSLVRFGTLHEGDAQERTGWIVEDCFVDRHCRVIGNIYENPDLLPQAA